MPKVKTSPPLTVHMIGNAHIDPVWLWPMVEGRAEVLSTYRTAIMLLDEFDSYVFTSGGAVTYQWVEEDDPQLFAQIQHAVSEGRWTLVNGWWLQPDCNIPGGESFARHALYGQRYLQKAFGKRAVVGYNVDSFGHAGTLPQLLKLGGLDYYVFFRPGPHEMTLPGGPFWWQSPGGCRVLACRPPLHYPSSAETNMLLRIQEAARLAPEGQSVIMCFFCVGNHGGGPSQRYVAQVAEIERLDSTLHPIFSSPEAYFIEMQANSTDWPVVASELQHHARGCYAALSRVKRENREAEHVMMAAERFSAMSTCRTGQKGDQEQLAQAWQQVLFNQFHDIMAGTSIRSAYEDVWRMYSEARATGSIIAARAKKALSCELTIADKENPFIIWNSLPWERREAVQFTVMMGGWHYDWRKFPDQPAITDDQGVVLPSQLLHVEFDHNSYIAHIEALVDVPALGARSVYAQIPQTDLPMQAPAAPECTIIENEFWRLEFDPVNGALTSLFDIEKKVEILHGQAGVPIVIDDPSDTWSHDIVSFRNECGRFTAQEPPVLLHNGPTRKTIRAHMGWGSSAITLEYTLRPQQKAVELSLDIDWQEQLKMLKLAFPLALKSPVISASAPYGSVTRCPNGEEEPCQAWVDLSGTGDIGELGLCIVTDSKYVYDALDNELRISLLRSPVYAFHDPRKLLPGVEYHYIDQGRQIVRCLLLPHTGAWHQAHPDRQSYELLEPLHAQPAQPQAGTGGTLSLLQVAPDNVVLSAVKVSEDEGYLLARGYETRGEATRVVISSSWLQKCWSADISANEVWSLVLPLDGSPANKVSFLEEPLSLCED